MYHRVWPGLRDGLTLTPEQLREQWLYLHGEGYTALSMSDFLSVALGKKPAPGKAVLLTFDDGYHNNLTYVYPLLQELGWCATIFIIGDTLDGTVAAEGIEEPDTKLTVAGLAGLDPAVIQLGMHGYHHENFSKIPVHEIEDAMARSLAAFEKTGLHFERVLAYPYGARPKQPADLRSMKEHFRKTGIRAAFRIGNRVEKVPSADMMEIMRIDIRGEDSLEDFKIKLRKGKLKPF